MRVDGVTVEGIENRFGIDLSYEERQLIEMADVEGLYAAAEKLDEGFLAFQGLVQTGSAAIPMMGFLPTFDDALARHDAAEFIRAACEEKGTEANGQ